jgi:hypothetical protein
LTLLIQNAKFQFGNVHIRHSNLNGQDIQDMLIPQELNRLSDIAIRDNTVFAVTGAKDAIIRLNKSGSLRDIERLDIAPAGGINGFKIFGRNSQKIEIGNPCAPEHFCQKLCLPSPKEGGGLSGRCACPYGEKLDLDNKSCVDNQLEEPPFIPCESPTYKCKKSTKSPEIVNV